MLTQREDVNIAAWYEAGWKISEIARHVGRDPKTVRAYLNGERTSGVRRSSEPDTFEPFVDYVRARMMDDHTIWASALYDEVVPGHVKVLAGGQEKSSRWCVGNPLRGLLER